MTAIGFMLISTHAGREVDVFKKLERMREIIDIYMLYGEYDILAKVRADSNEKLSDFVQNKLHKVPFIQNTNVLLGPQV